MAWKAAGIWRGLTSVIAIRGTRAIRWYEMRSPLGVLFVSAPPARYLEALPPPVREGARPPEKGARGKSGLAWNGVAASSGSTVDYGASARSAFSSLKLSRRGPLQARTWDDPGVGQVLHRSRPRLALACLTIGIKWQNRASIGVVFCRDSVLIEVPAKNEPARLGNRWHPRAFGVRQGRPWRIGMTALLSGSCSRPLPDRPAAGSWTPARNRRMAFKLSLWT